MTSNSASSTQNHLPNVAIPELLAPAGDFERLRFAIAYGATAVYAGQPQFSLRSRENGFTSIEEVAKGIAYAHAHGVKFYLASNIIPHNRKIKALQQSLSDFAALKPDAFIMTDPGMIAYVKQNHPQIDIHLSVQANCTNWSTAQFWYNQGVSRIILSRELHLREVQEIRDAVPQVELEVFVHGAICMAHSGRCMLSNYMSYRDANQGMCSNACRFSYHLYKENTPQSEQYIPFTDRFYLKENTPENQELMLVDEDEFGTYFMNSKDMCAIEVLEDLMLSGVCSFKIEGRTKSIYYLSQVVKGYRGAIDDLCAGNSIQAKHIQAVKSTDSRGYIPGFFKDGNRLPQNLETTKVPGTGSSVAGLIRSWDATTQQATISVKGKITEHSPILIMTPHWELEIKAQNLHNNKKQPVQALHPGLENCSIFVPQDPGEYAFICNTCQNEES
jgi:U32 family peptidase